MLAEVTVALTDEIGCVVVLSIEIGEPIAVPPEAQPVAEVSGPHSENCRLPFQVDVPLTVTRAKRDERAFVRYQIYMKSDVRLVALAWRSSTARDPPSTGSDGYLTTDPT